jgi:prominin 1
VPRILSALDMMADTSLLVFALITLTSLHKPGHVTVHAAQPVDVTVLSPENVSDASGNTADRDSNISFARIPTSNQYHSKGKTADDVGPIGTFYNMAKSIASSSLPGEFPYVWARKFKDGDIKIQDDWKKIATDYLGYCIALVVGILFILIFPIVGCCFCCCRCCGRCGGSRVIGNPSQAGQEDKCGRIAGMSILGAFTALILTGSILMFVTNSNLSAALQNFHDDDIDKIDDLPEFFNSTIAQAEQLIVVNFNFTLAVLFRDLDNIGYLLGVPLHDQILNSTGLGKTYDDIDALDSDAQNIFKNLKTLESNKQLAKESSDLFYNFTTKVNKTVEDLAKKYPDFDNNVSNRNFEPEFNASKLPDENFKIAVLNASLSNGVHSLTDESKKKLTEIPERIQNETQTKRDDLKNDAAKYTKDVTKIIDDLKSMKSDVLGGLNVNGIKDDAKDYTNTATKYDKYRWYGGLAIAIISMITGLLLALGIFFGIFGGSHDDDPTMRSCPSNSGGNMLIAGVIITFFFGALTMLVTTVLFAVGSPADKFVCRAAQDLRIFDKLVDDNHLFGEQSGNGSWLGDTVYAGKQVTLKLSQLMESCKNDETVYFALKMEEASVFNLSDVTDYKKTFNIDNVLSSAVVNFDNINITTGPMMDFIQFIGNFDSTMEYTTYNDTLKEDPVEPSKRFLQALNTYITTGNLNGSKLQEFEDLAKDFATNISDSGAALEISIKAIGDALKNIQDTTQTKPIDLKAKCDNLEQSLRQIEMNLSQNIEDSFTNSLKSFEARLGGIMDFFVDKLTSSVKKEIGACRPIWNLYSDMVVYGLCSSAIGSLNGWWCAIGWTTFFQTLSIVAAVKLSKHFRRMKLSTKPAPEKSHVFKNKVYHSDMASGQ